MQFNPTKAQIESAKNLLVAQRKEDEIRPIVVSYETEILHRRQFRIDQQWISEFGMQDKVILERKDAFLLSQADLNVFYEECYAARDAAGLFVEKADFCPLLVAESNRMKAENDLMKKISEIPGLDQFEKTHLLTISERKRAIELILSLMAPYLHSAREIMHRLQSVAE